jgi:cardiolipin synthase A/B
MLDVDENELRRRLETLLGVAATEGNEVQVLRNGVQIFPAMLAAIGSASRTVDLLTYIYWTGWPAEAFAAALADRARAGCRVRVLIDAVGGARMDHGLTDRMREAGVAVQFFRPPLVRSPLTHNHRTHRKVLVVDGEVGFTGGVGIAEQWAGDARNPDEWRDTHIRVRGPAVPGLQAAFTQNWAESVGDLDESGVAYPPSPQIGEHTLLVVRGTATLGWDDLKTAWYALLTSARTRITLQSAYFTPHSGFVDLLLQAAGRGVLVQVLLPGRHYDKTVSRLASERYFQPLTEAGVEVWRYQPTMLHTKILTVDHRVAMIGSSNFNRRSLDHDEEVACIVIGGSVPVQLLADFEHDLSRSARVEADDWRSRSMRNRVSEQLVGPLMRFL